MDDYIADINRAFKDLEAKRATQTLQSVGSTSTVEFSFQISEEIADTIQQRREEDERMQKMSYGVYE
ncbi:MAG: hypothetical protein LBQ66_10350 [Planctomycetaceae bacterium]|jgi:hypothetical protein|nr:hypothetical protein [Planctomycetaceae bacterium]